MPKFNQTVKSSKVGTNMAGGYSVARAPKAEFVMAIVNSLLTGTDSYYEKETNRTIRIKDLALEMAKKDPEFLAKALVYTRGEAKLRSVSHILGTVLAAEVKGSKLVRKALVQAVMRPDDMTEMFSLWKSEHPNVMLPNSMRRAFKEALESKFDAYQLKKYAGSSQAVKLKDVVKLARPNPSAFEDKEIFKKVIEDTLPAIDTLQTNLSNGGNAAEEFERMLKDKTLGYMAAVKNIRNALDKGLSDEGIALFETLMLNDKIREKSKILPFRFIDAWVAIRQANVNAIKAKRVKRILDKAFSASAKNIEIAKPGERVALLLDESGSMGSGYGKDTPFYLGLVMTAAVSKALNTEDVLFYTWADKCTERTVSESVCDFVTETRTHGGGTDISAPLRKLIETKTAVDKIVIFTDMQMYSLTGYGYGHTSPKSVEAYIEEYRNTVNPNVKVLFWNLQGYPQGAPMDMNKQNIYEVGGYSDAMLSVVSKLWEDKDAFIKEIEAVRL